MAARDRQRAAARTKVAWVIESVSDGIIIIDDYGYFVAANQTAQLITGYTEEELTDRIVIEHDEMKSFIDTARCRIHWRQTCK